MQFYFQDDIGIVTPYKDQEKAIKRELIRRNLHPKVCFRSQVQVGAFSNYVEVGCVEKFQGNEKSVIIFSTVKSKERLPKKRVKGVNGSGRGPPRKISAGVSLRKGSISPTFEVYQIGQIVRNWFLSARAKPSASTFYQKFHIHNSLLTYS